MALEDEVESKRRELNYLKHVSALTERLKSQLDELSVQVSQMNKNADIVKDVMANWDSVLRSISQASISLLQYTENDYETGKWANKEKESGDSTDIAAETDGVQQGTPLPETLVRVKVTDDAE